MVSAGGEISVWDIEKLVCREVFRPAYFVPQSPSHSYEPWQPEEKGTSKILERFTSDLEADEDLLEPDLHSDGKISSLPSTPTKPDKQAGDQKSVSASARRSRNDPITTLYPITDFVYNSSQPSDPKKSSILISAGVDKTLRYWDIGHPELSFIVSGPPLQLEEGTVVKVRYDLSHPLHLHAGGQIALISEKIDEPGRERERDTAPSTTSRSTPRKGLSRMPSAATAMTTPPRSNTPTSGVKSSPNKGVGGTSKPPRNSLISISQQQLLKTHIDPITDVTVLRKPYGCIVSVDQGGCVYIFH